MTDNFTPIDDLILKYKPNKNTGISLPTKESEPVLSEKIEIKEIAEYEIEDEEVKPFVNVRHQTIKLPPDLKKLSFQRASSSKSSSYKNIRLPISDDKIIIGLKAPVTSSLRWLATFAVYLLSKAHLGLKVIGGKVVRVLKE